MKKIIFLLFLVMAFSESKSFAVCDSERKSAVASRGICNDWTNASVLSGGAAGTVAAILLAPWPFGVLGGLTGLLPGTIAARVCALADEKEQILQDCINSAVVARMRADEIQRFKIREAKTTAAGKRLGDLFVIQMERARNRYNEECQALIARYVAAGKDITDPVVQRELFEEQIEIKSRYY